MGIKDSESMWLSGGRDHGKIAEIIEIEADARVSGGEVS
jgi:hypothetical protein